MKCPNCNAEVQGLFCSYCGSELPKSQNVSTVSGNVIINNYYSKDNCFSNGNLSEKEKIAKDLVEKYNKNQKALMVKELRERTGISLNEAMDLIENNLKTYYSEASYKQKQVVSNNNPVNRNTSLILCIFLGWCGIHKFYEGKTTMGIVYVFTMGLFGIGWFADIFIIAAKPNPYYV